MSSLSSDTLNLLSYLAGALFFYYAGVAIFRAVRNWAQEAREDKLAPVKLSASQSMLRSLDPSRWGGSQRSVLGQALVREAYPILRRARGKYLLRYPIPGGAFGFPSNPFGQKVHYDLIWYQYEVKGKTIWGKFQFPFGFGSLEEATTVARNLAGKTIPIQYDPETPEDSKPVLPPILKMLNL
jgi:hypothetical protein